MGIRLITVGKDWLDGESPLLQLSGMWLSDLGFASGKKVVVEEKDGGILLNVSSMNKW
ncbi:MAG: hypothetical protein N3B21_04755 [Clostridia bacterium]|nr:hypothetical protein [Clostridia bacterium]